MSQITIRKAKLNDAYNLIRLLIPEFGNETDLNLSTNNYYIPWLENFKTMLKSEVVKIFLATDDQNELSGILTVYLLPGLELAGFYGVIDDVFIKESERSKGIGSLLFQEVIKYLKEKDVLYITLNVENDNEEGLEFYKKLGFAGSAVEMRLDLQE